MNRTRLVVLLALALGACEPGGGESGERACPAGMVYVQPGTFRMGCPGTEDDACSPTIRWGDPCDSDEAPAHDVTLTGFCIDRTEVTVAAYAVCLEQGGPCAVPFDRHPNCNWKGGVPRAGRENHPVNCVSWVDADVYCRWRTGCTGRGCGLPSEAQWEFAARGPGRSPRKYPWGAASPDCTYANWGEYAEVEGDGQCVGETVPVCSTPAGNTPGADLCDLSGNVWELMRDYYAPDFYCRPEASGVDPENRTESPPTTESPGYTPESPAIAIRGGSWYDDYLRDYLRASKRDYYGELEKVSTLGFRCVAAPLPAADSP